MRGAVFRTRLGDEDPVDVTPMKIKLDPARKTVKVKVQKTQLSNESFWTHTLACWSNSDISSLTQMF